MFDPVMPANTARGILTLLQLEGVGTKTAQRIIERFPTLASARDAALSGDLSSSLNRVPASLAEESAWEEAASRAQQILDKAAASEVRLLTAWDPDYPELLRCIPDRPLVLYLRGTLLPGRSNVACVGTREPSPFGIQVTQRIVQTLVESGWTIISGLALGVDAEAHRQALATGGKTIAVLGNGLDTVYPKVHLKLAEEIVEAGGALISEQPFGVPATAHNLVQRDRLQSGMSVGTVIMQTDIKGGSMHTARFTLLQGRRLFAPVPTGMHAHEPRSHGTLALTHKTGIELLGLLKKIPSDFAGLLRHQFATSPPATPLRSSEDYAAMLEILSATAEAGVGTSPQRSTGTSGCTTQRSLF